MKSTRIKKASRSLAAKKGWKTRRARAAAAAAKKEAAEKEAARKRKARAAAAKKGWEKRRAAAAAAEKEAARKRKARQEAAKKGWETRRAAAVKAVKAKPKKAKPKKAKPKKAKPKKAKPKKAKPKKAKPLPVVIVRPTTPEDQIRAILLAGRDKIGGVVSVVPNFDDSVDGEHRIDIPPGVDINDYLISEVEAVYLPLFRSGWSKGMFVSLGIRVPPTQVAFDAEESGSRYERYMGLIQFRAFPQRLKQAAENFQTLRDEIIDNLLANGWPAPDHAFVSLHYSPNDVKPNRDDLP